MKGGHIRKAAGSVLVLAGSVALWLAAGSSRNVFSGSEYEMSSDIKLLPSAGQHAAQLFQPEAPAMAELQAVTKVLRAYLLAVGSFPSSRNEDLVASLLGRNPKGTALLPPNTFSIRDGALVDRWGSRYWFHLRDAKAIKVRSPGPDREAFTNDDLISEDQITP